MIGAPPLCVSDRGDMPCRTAVIVHAAVNVGGRGFGAGRQVRCTTADARCIRDLGFHPRL